MVSSETAASLLKLIPLLGSDQDGEVVGAARAIARKLQAEGRDLHDLADHLTRPRAERFVWTQPDFARPAPEPEKPTGETGMWDLFSGKRLSWSAMAKVVIDLNRSIPKRYGGKSIPAFQLKLLDRIRRDGAPTNAEVCMIEHCVLVLSVAKRAEEAAARRAA